MNNDGYRCNGGIGFTISEPHAKIEVSVAQTFELDDKRQFCLQSNELAQLKNTILNLSPAPLKIVISGDLPSHMGLGSATSIRLGVIEALHWIESRDTSPQRLVSDSGRGGTSGIGVTTYFDGGMVFDVGFSQLGFQLAPSSAIEKTRPPPLVLTGFSMPDWEIGVCIPGTILPQTADQESSFFNSICPLPSNDVHETLYHVVYGVVASARESNKLSFCKAIKAIQGCAWKRGEWSLYGLELRSIEHAIYEAGADVVGLSSLGPGLFFLAESVDEVISTMRSKLPEHLWYCARTWNSGRTIACP